MKDYFGAAAGYLKKKRLFLFDMDGTIYEEDSLFPGTLELLDTIVKNGGEYVFITNNSSKSVEDYISKVNRFGIKAAKDNFFTSAQATVLLLKEKYPLAKVYCQGTKSLISELYNSGINVTDDVSSINDIDLVLVGFDTELTSEKLRKTCCILSKRSIPYYATNCDLRCPVNFGFIPDCGSICSMIENCTGKRPIFIGKPEPTMVEIAMKKFNRTKEETAVVGDRLYTDIATGLNAAVTSICVLTGEATVDEIENGTIKPDLTFHSVFDVYKCIL